ncbi:MAG: DUF2029 domain-containing protein [Proteobacteria bacterium]|nr:DUF2029 domain-containing protein [Pseudomonadota bacterium]
MRPAPPAACPVAPPTWSWRAGLAWLLHWPARAPRTGRLAAVALVLPTMLAIQFYVHLGRGPWTGYRPFGDFFAFWSWSAMTHMLVHPLALYTPATVQAFLQGEQPLFHGHYPFAYPPSFLLVIWPLALAPRLLAYVVWSAVGLGAYLAATMEAPWRRPIAVLLVLAPATGLTLQTGQDGLLLAALLIGGCRLLGRRPVLAGVLLGLAACKPQFGLLVPLALLAACQWRAIAAATATVLASVLASAAAFGWAMWGRWITALWGLSGFVAGNKRLHTLMPTVTGSLHLMGAGPVARTLAQIAVGLIAAICVWLCWRRGPGRLASAALLAGCFLATPYAFCFDLPILNGALLAIVLERIEADAAFGLWEFPLLFAAAVLPWLMADSHTNVPWAAFVLPPLFALIVTRALRRGPPGAVACAPGDRTPEPRARRDQPAIRRPEPGRSPNTPSPNLASAPGATARNAGYS